MIREKRKWQPAGWIVRGSKSGGQQSWVSSPRHGSETQREAGLWSPCGGPAKRNYSTVQLPNTASWSKNDTSACAGRWAHTSSTFSKYIEVVISVLLLGDRWPLKPVVIAMYWSGICDQYCLYRENFKYKLHRISVWEDKSPVWRLQLAGALWPAGELQHRRRGDEDGDGDRDRDRDGDGDGDTASAQPVPRHRGNFHNKLFLLSFAMCLPTDALTGGCCSRRDHTARN